MNSTSASRPTASSGLPTRRSLPALLAACLAVGLAGAPHAPGADDAADADDAWRAEREHMVDWQIARRGVTPTAVLQAMRTVPRHLFVPPDQRRFAYADRPLPIGHGQTISQPYIVAAMTEAVGIDARSRVLEIGAGSGYQAAVLAALGAAVYTIEIVPALAVQAEHNLRQAGYPGVTVKQADGYHGWAEHAPFDAIVVTAAAPHIPPPLLAQLKDGGRMIIPVGSPYLTQQLVLVEKTGENLRTRNLMPVRFVPFTRADGP